MKKDRDYEGIKATKPLMNTVLIIGCGDIGERVGRLTLANQKKEFARVIGLVRSENRARQLLTAGIESVRGDLGDAHSLVDLVTSGATVFYFAPPPTEGEHDPLLGNFLTVIKANSLPEKIVLLSTTAVYGDCGGGWISEQSDVNPETARGRRRLDAEHRLRTWCEKNHVSFVILRVGGIYGPGRWPLERLKKGLPVLHEVESPYTNRIHQDDLAQICIAAAERGKSGEIYNIADGQPGTMSAYFKAIAGHFGLPQPEEVSLQQAQQVMSAGMLSYLKESRRIDNRKLLTELQITLLYPNLEAGLADA